MADRSRRELANKADKFAELRKARQGGPRSWKEREAKIYDEVSENQYRVRMICLWFVASRADVLVARTERRGRQTGSG